MCKNIINAIKDLSDFKQQDIDLVLSKYYLTYDDKIKVLSNVLFGTDTLSYLIINDKTLDFLKYLYRLRLIVDYQS